TRSLLGDVFAEPFLHQRPALMAYVVFALEDAPPAQGGQQPLRALVIRPELGQVAASLRGTLLEGRQKSVGVPLVPLLGQDPNTPQVCHPPSQPVLKPADPVPDLVAQNEVMVVGAARARKPLLLLEQLREPGREVLVLAHFS